MAKKPFGKPFGGAGKAGASDAKSGGKGNEKNVPSWLKGKKK
jgi:hypothetical protein